jgi:hypothetical protein
MKYGEEQGMPELSGENRARMLDCLAEHLGRDRKCK